jgi:hypothetical protein
MGLVHDGERAFAACAHDTVLFGGRGEGSVMEGEKWRDGGGMGEGMGARKEMGWEKG